MRGASQVLASLGAFGVVALATRFVLAQFAQRAATAKVLSHIEPYRSERVAPGPGEARPPSSGRLAARWAGELRRRLPSTYIDRLSRNLVLAGRSGPTELDRILLRRLAVVALIPLWVALGAALVPWLGGLALALAGFAVVASILGGNIVLVRQVTARQAAMADGLPDLLDLLTISVEAGLGFEQALARVVRSMRGPLAEECQRMLRESQAGATRADALRALSGRVVAPELRTFVQAVIQSDRLGSPIGTILRTQSEEMRIRRQQRAQERAMKAPVKMLVPIVFCIFPALFVVVIGPAVLKFRLGTG